MNDETADMQLGAAGVPLLDPAQLNAAQLDAVTSTEGFVRVIAGAGSGKTRALAHRFAYLVNDLGIMPGNILCVTFTSKAAHEMRQRIHQLTGDNDTGYVNTFHGFCVSVLREDSHVVSYPKNFLVLDNADIDQMLALIYEERGITLRDMTFSQARDMIEVQKLFKRPKYFLDLVNMSLESVQRKYESAQTVEDVIFFGYLYQQKKCFGLDYNDLIKFTLHIFELDEEVALKWQQRLEYVMIDEFQDIDGLQYELMEALTGFHGNLFVVGDPDQTIYTWRGANVRYLLDFDMAHPGTKTIMMNDNYRSTPQVVAASNALIAQNAQRMSKELVSQRGNGPKPVCHHAKDAAGEGRWIAEQIECLRAEGVAYRDIAVLYRAHYVTRSVEEALQQADIPFQINSGMRFFDRTEVKDALAYLRMVAFADDLSFARIVNKPKRNMGEKRMRFLAEEAQARQCSLFDALVVNLDHPIMAGTQARAFADLVNKYALEAFSMRVSELLAALLDESGYERALRTEGSQERLDNLAELRQSVFDYETSCGEEATLENYLSHVALFSNLDVSYGKDKVRLMTVHAAKGLEFDQVFLCGMNEGIFPSRKVRTLSSMEEERRLAFVAMTRACDALYLTCADGSNLDGSPRYPSRFIFDIGDANLTFTEPLPEQLVKQAKGEISRKTRKLRDAAEGPRYSCGDYVKHAVFGKGEIVDIDMDRGSYLVLFEGLDTPRSLSWKAKLDPASSD